MIRIRDRIAGEPITFYRTENGDDLGDVAEFVKSARGGYLGIDTESTGLNCYVPGWRLRSVQIGDRNTAFVIPASARSFGRWMVQQDIRWIGHNGPHDWRSIDQWLGYETGGYCIAETYLPAHHSDPRGIREGGTGLGLKELACAYVDGSAGRWEVELKNAFKEITIPIPGEVYKSGPRKGLPKVRKATLGEGWGLIDPLHPAYIAYSAADPLLTYRVWEHFLPVAREQNELYRRDWRIQDACDRLERRGIRLDIRYTERLNRAYLRKAQEFERKATERFSCHNVNSGAQVAATLEMLGVRLTARTPTGKPKTDDKILRGILESTTDARVREFIRCVLGAKQLHKRRESYTQAFLAEMDADGRVHASINSLKARTARMSISRPPLQQLPTKDREGDEKFTAEDMENLLDATN